MKTCFAVFALLFATNVAAVDLEIFSNPPLATPGIRNPLPITYRNVTTSPSSGATILVRVPRALGFVVPPNCTSDGALVTCKVGPIPAMSPSGVAPLQTLTIEPILPLEHETSFAFEVEIVGNEPDPVPASNVRRGSIITFRAFFVTSTVDAGPGSLREAILTSEAACVGSMQCQIAFRIDSVAAVKSIRPSTPLPRIGARRLVIDGSTQTRYSGDTNPRGPEVEINGSRQGSGHGLDLAVQCAVDVRGLVVNGFPGFGLVLRNSACDRYDAQRVIRDNYIGTDATGTVAVPNGRGVLVDVVMTSEFLTHLPWRVIGNVISGNARAGVWVESGRMTEIFRNTIGLDVTRTAGLGNGASGVFVNGNGYATDVFENYIGFNAHAGVSVARNAHYVAVFANSIQANAQGAIDWNLDGPSPTGNVKAPTILSATYDPAGNVTTIHGLVDAQSTFPPTVFVHANDAPDPGGFGEGQYYLGSVRANGNFEFRAPGDWRGKWIAANAMRNDYVGWLIDGPVEGNGSWQGFLTTTSEFGNAVQVP